MNLLFCLQSTFPALTYAQEASGQLCVPSDPLTLRPSQPAVSTGSLTQKCKDNSRCLLPFHSPRPYLNELFHQPTEQAGQMRGPQLIAAESSILEFGSIWKKRKSIKHTLFHHLTIQHLAGTECHLQSFPFPGLWLTKRLHSSPTIELETITSSSQCRSRIPPRIPPANSTICYCQEARAGV